MTDDVQIETKAASMGWVPKERFRGGEENWIDAKTFVDRGEQFLPILKANNRRLEEEHNGTVAEVQRLKALLESSQESIAELKKFHDENTKAQVEAAKTQILRSLKKAKEDDDLDAEVRLTDELSQVNSALREEKARVTEDKPTKKADEPGIDPAFTAWQSQPENSWFGKDRRRTVLAIAVAQDLRASGDRSSGAAFYDKVAAEVESTMGGSRKEQVDKVSGGKGGGSGEGSGDGRGVKDLPADARAVCKQQAAKMVGPGKAFKDAASWEAYYCQHYIWD